MSVKDLSKDLESLQRLRPAPTGSANRREVLIALGVSMNGTAVRLRRRWRIIGLSQHLPRPEHRPRLRPNADSDSDPNADTDPTPGPPPTPAAAAAGGPHADSHFWHYPGRSSRNAKFTPS